MSIVARVRWAVAGWIVTAFCKEYKDWGSTYRFKIANFICPGDIPDSW